jgi:hypothetical protein
VAFAIAVLYHLSAGKEDGVGLEWVFLLIFFFSLFLVVITTLVGELFQFGGEVAHDVGGVLHGAENLDFGHDAGADSAGQGEVGTPSILSSRVLFAGMTLFGAFGFIATAQDWSPLVAVLVGLLGFFGGGFGMYFGIMMPIARQQGGAQVSRVGFLNLQAQVADEIPENGLGNVTLVAPGSGALHTEAARSVDGARIPRGASVTVVGVNPRALIVKAEGG